MSRCALAVAFADAARRYWLTVFPRVRRELRRWRRRAEAIPDPVLRRIALETQRAERGNLEGAAAYAAFVPPRRRAAVVRATVAFQVAYDYVDSLVEQPVADTAANGAALHGALRVALDVRAPHGDYYAHHPQRDDGGYLAGLADGCRGALLSLPAWQAVAHPARRAAERMVAYQVLIHGEDASNGAQLAAWARAQTPPGSGLLWWETAAAGASSLLVFALVAAAASPSLTARETDALEHVYFPWAGALHVLLDSLVDQPADAQAGHRSLVDHYASPEQLAERMGLIADATFRSTRTLPDGRAHGLILAAMASFYLVAPTAQLPAVAEATRRVVAAMGRLAAPALAVLRLRRAAGRVARAAPSQDEVPEALSGR
jgi:tetraprenyl-beta-curcumene synthase